MPRRSIFPNPDNKPAGFSPATRVGSLVFVSGQVSVDASGNLVGEGDCQAQAEQVLDNVEAALKAAGVTMSDVAKITAFLINDTDYAAYASVRSMRFLAPGPASSTVFVKGLVNPKFLIEIEAIAVAS